MERLTKTYEDGTHGVADSLPCGENSYAFKNLLIETIGKYEDTGFTPQEILGGRMPTGWIPVWERLPEYSGFYLVCLDDDYITSVEYATDKSGNQDWELWADSGEVIAWMPLPEPYRPEAEAKLAEMENADGNN